MATPIYFSLPFREQIAFFRRKKNVLTEGWTDVWQAEHDHAFMVAGANRMDLLLDLRAAIDKAIAAGTGLEEFRADFDAIVAKHGWAYNGGRNWRTRVIFETNLRTSYAAGRWQQLQRIKKYAPWWRYRHSDSVQHPRPLHVAWDGLVLHADDPWWKTRFPPNGWGCQCTVEALEDRDLKKLGKAGPDKAPDDGMEEVTVGKRGPNPMTVTTPAGVDPGFGYAPGASVDNAALAQRIAARAMQLPPDVRAAALEPLLDIRVVREALAATQAAQAAEEAAAMTALRAIAGNARMDAAVTAIGALQLPGTMTESQAVALHLWSQDTADDALYLRIGKTLRGTIDELAPLMPLIERIDAALRNIPPTRSLVLAYRGMQPFTDAGLWQQFLAAHRRVGAVVEWRGFTAASETVQIARQFAGRDGYTFIIRRGGSARDIHAWVDYQGEAEWLFPRGAQFRVVAVDDQRRTITLMEVPPSQRRKVRAAAQFAAPAEKPWWTPTAEELAASEAVAAEIDAYDKGVADGSIKPKPLTRAQRMLGRHMQA